MGASDLNPFHDDDGADFAREILESDGLALIADAVYAVPEELDEYVETTTATRAIVAAELIADQLGNGSSDVSNQLHNWIMDREKIDEAVVRRARIAVKRVMVDSELCELWDDSKDWKDRTEHLLKRLN